MTLHQDTRIALRGSGEYRYKEFNLNRARVVEEENDVGVSGGVVGRGAGGDFAQPPKNIAGLVPEVLPNGES